MELNKRKNAVQRNYILSGIICLGLISALGCTPKAADFKATLAEGIKTFPHEADLKSMFPDAKIFHFFSSCGYGYDNSTTYLWNTEVCFAGRYFMNYRVEVMPDFSRHAIKQIMGKPRFVIEEVEAISKDGDGATFANTFRFDEAGFQKVLDAHGNFSAIGIDIRTNSPITGFVALAHMRFDAFIHIEN